MRLHANAALSLNQRRRMVRRVLEQGWSLTTAAAAAEVSERTCSKWVRRYRADGEAGLLDRSSAPGAIPHRTPEDRVELIATLRRLCSRRPHPHAGTPVGNPGNGSAVIESIGTEYTMRTPPQGDATKNELANRNPRRADRVRGPAAA
jgi:transposase-like protein